jgi:hypothetical protein
MTLPPSESLHPGRARTPPLRDIAPPPGPVSGASQRLLHAAAAAVWWRARRSPWPRRAV